MTEAIEIDNVIVIDSRNRDKVTYPDTSQFSVDVNIPLENILTAQLLLTRIPNTIYNIRESNNRLFLIHGSHFEPSYFSSFGGDVIFENIVSSTNSRSPPLLLEIKIDPGYYTKTQIVQEIQEQINTKLADNGITGEDYKCEYVSTNNRFRISCTDTAQYFSIFPQINSTFSAQSVLDTLTSNSIASSFSSVEDVLEKTANVINEILGYTRIRWNSNFHTRTPGYDANLIFLDPSTIETSNVKNVNVSISPNGLNMFVESYLYLYILELENESGSIPPSLNLSTEEQKALLQNRSPVAKVVIEPPFGDTTVYNYYQLPIKKTLTSSVSTPSKLTVVWSFQDNTFCSFQGIDITIMLKFEPDNIIGDENEL